MLNKLQMQIQSYERHHGFDQVNLDRMNDEQLVAYLTELRRKYWQDNQSDKVEAIVQEPEQKEESTQPKRIKVAPTIQDTEAQEKELGKLLCQLKKVNRHWKIQWARKKDVPMKALLHAANLWLSDDLDDWTAANDTIFAFTSPWGCRRLCYQRSKNVTIPKLKEGNEK